MDDRTLDTLAEQINEEYRRALRDQHSYGLSSRARGHILRAGELLEEAKAKCSEETWQAWLEENFAGTVEAAQNCLKLYTTDRTLRVALDFLSDDRNLTGQGIAAREILLGDLEAIEQEHRLD
jgi:hypothetical protein